MPARRYGLPLGLAVRGGERSLDAMHVHVDANSSPAHRSADIVSLIANADTIAAPVMGRRSNSIINATVTAAKSPFPS